MNFDDILLVFPFWFRFLFNSAFNVMVTNQSIISDDSSHHLNNLRLWQRASIYNVSNCTLYNVHALDPVQTVRNTCRVCKLVPLQTTHILYQSLHWAVVNMRGGHFSPLLLALVLLSFISSGQCSPRGGRGGGGRGGRGGGSGWSIFGSSRRPSYSSGGSYSSRSY